MKTKFVQVKFIQDKFFGVFSYFLISSIFFTNAVFALGFSHGPAGQDPYQIGDKWSKVRVDNQWLANSPKDWVRAAKATAAIGRATGFYLGKFEGEHIIATNHHVIESAAACRAMGMRLPLLNVQVRCKKHLGSWPEIDLSLQTVEIVLKKDQKLEDVEKSLSEVAKNFSFDKRLTRGQKLITIGYGINRNPLQNLVISDDEDCEVYSKDGDYRLSGDPDTINPADYKAWSFVHGCDASHGDSGSALVDRGNGEVIGILWTGASPKIADVQDSKKLTEWLREENDKQIWSQMNLGVPAEKMGEYLYALVNAQKTFEKPSLDVEAQKLLLALLKDGRAKDPTPPVEPKTPDQPKAPEAPKAPEEPKK